MQRSPVGAQEEDVKVQEEQEEDPCKGGTFGIQFEMYGPLICSGHWRVVRGFVLVCVCVHVSLPLCVRMCARVCMSERTAQAVTYTAAETTEVGGGDGADQKRDSGGERYQVRCDWLYPLHMRTLTYTPIHTYTQAQSLHSPPPCLHIHSPVKGRIESMLPSKTLAPPL